ncbi:MAG: hypothetical protein Ta2E_12570 [Mycoplasmoidaceae bacterium]|nr:MAG: hypothetical protein Ta2E_12570 [Mycoplasmoidaceae bacterium]
MKYHLFRFTIRVRNDTLWTPTKQAIISRGQNIGRNCSCGNGRFYNTLHILNNCENNET